MSARTVVTLLIVAAFLVIIVGFLPAPQPTAAQTSTIDLSGWLWSSNIGWVSLSGTAGDGSSYQVFINSSGNFSGYAWSSNIGWINFAPQQTAPDGSANPAHIPVTSSNGELGIADGATATGWIRACAVFASGCSGGFKLPSSLGGWDGWGKLSGKAASGADYGVSKVTFHDINGQPAGEGLVGYAWGGDNLGWINFNTKNSGCAVGDASCHPVPPDCGTNPTLPECGTHIDPGAPPSGLTCTVTGPVTYDPVDPVTHATTAHITWHVEPHGADGVSDYFCGLPPTPDGEPVGSDPGSVDNASTDSVGNTGINSDGGSGDPLISHQSNHLLPLNLLGLPSYAATTGCGTIAYYWGTAASLGGDVNGTTQTIVENYPLDAGGSEYHSGHAKVSFNDNGVPKSQPCQLDNVLIQNQVPGGPDLRVETNNSWVQILTHAAGLPSAPARNDNNEPAKIRNNGAGESGALRVKSLVSVPSGQSLYAIAADPAYYPKCSITVASGPGDNTIPPSTDFSWQDCASGSWTALGPNEIGKFTIKLPRRGNRFTTNSPYRITVGDVDGHDIDTPITLYYRVGGISEY